MELQELVERIERWKQRIADSESQPSQAAGEVSQGAKAREWDSDATADQRQAAAADFAQDQAASVDRVDEAAAVDARKLDGDDQGDAEVLDIDDPS